MPGHFESLHCEVSQTKVIPDTAAVFMRARGMSTFGAIIFFILIVQIFFDNIACKNIAKEIVFCAFVYTTSLAQVRPPTDVGANLFKNRIENKGGPNCRKKSNKTFLEIDHWPHVVIKDE